LSVHGEIVREPQNDTPEGNNKSLLAAAKKSEDIVAAAKKLEDAVGTGKNSEDVVAAGKNSEDVVAAGKNSKVAAGKKPDDEAAAGKNPERSDSSKAVSPVPHPEQSDGLWFENPAHWVSRGKEAISALEIALDAGVKA
jgi:hypothetical protein